MLHASFGSREARTEIALDFCLALAGYQRRKIRRLGPIIISTSPVFACPSCCKAPAARAVNFYERAKLSPSSILFTIKPIKPLFESR